MNGSITLIYL